MKRNLAAIFFLVAIQALGIDLALGQVRAERIAVIASHDAAPYKEVLTGFQHYLKKQRVEAELDIYPLGGDAAKAAHPLQDAKKKAASLLFTIGSLATEMALREPVEIPIIAGMILSGKDLGGRANATGVVLEFPLEAQFQWLRRFLPQARTIGVMYNQKENQEKIDDAIRVAHKMGFELAAQKVNAPDELPAALKDLAKKADVFWGVADSLVLTPQTAKHILLFCFRNRIPFVGLSPAWVKAGALYALDWDYTDLGMQCGDMALKVLHGAMPSSIPPARPRKVGYSVNLKTARHMKLKIPEAIVRGSSNVF